MYLGSFLQGNALKFYVSLPTENFTNYDRVKEALHRAYSVETDLYRLKFR